MATEIDIALARGLVPQRPADGHKGTFGHVFVLAGSRGFTGAAKMACEAAARSGAGLVTAGVPRPLADVVAASLIETMSLPLPATDAESFALDALAPALEFAGTKQAVVLGPGLSQHADTRAFVVEFLRQCTVPTLVDADGLNALSADPAALDTQAGSRVLTPHPGEMARLIGGKSSDVQRDREGAARAFAEHHGCALVLKGHRTVVADPDGDVRVNTTGNSGLASGGTGDVLSGLVGGLMAQGMAGFDAATLGVYLHGLAGDLAAQAKTERGMIASDVIDAIPAAWRVVEAGGRP